MKKHEMFIIIFSGLLIFSFASADNAVSPLVGVFHGYYLVSMPTVLLLISSCTFGIVIGMLLGPIFIANLGASKTLISATILLSLSTLLFILTKQFNLAVLWRMMFGFFSGLLANVMWWLTFQYTKGKASDAMVVVMMTARPVALCLGIPLTGLIATHLNWQAAFGVFLVLTLLSGLVLYVFSKKDKASHTKHISGLFREYSNVFKLSYSLWFYLGMFLNACGYFGFYAFAGIWFIKHYQLTLRQISTLFLFIGMGEIIINFISPWLYRKLVYKKLFTLICIANLIVFGLFINAQFRLLWTVLLIVLFIMLNRVFLFPVIRNIPVLFKTHENKATLGALITLSMWLGFAIVSWLQAKLLLIVGINFVGNLLLTLLGLGLLITYWVQKRMVFEKIQYIK